MSHTTRNGTTTGNLGGAEVARGEGTVSSSTFKARERV